MNSPAKQNISATVVLHRIANIAATGFLLLVSLSTSLSAAETSYRSEEGPAHTADEIGSGLTPVLGISASNSLLKSAPENDNHLTITTNNILWYGGDIWITDIGTLLYIDDDQDGYFSGFSLTIDADTDYSHADVYATIDVRRSQGERERLHTTGSFSIYGNSLTDEYRIDIELVRNYPIGDYDLFVNLVDANDHAVLDTVGANDISNLSRLPLESEEFDNDPAPITPVTQIHSSTTNSNIRVVEHSGAGSAWLLLALGIPAIIRQAKEIIKFK